jgi:hypothetical protein
MKISRASVYNLLAAANKEPAAKSPGKKKLNGHHAHAALKAL